MQFHSNARRILALLVLGALAAPCGVAALTLVATPKRDNTLYESTTGSLSNGAGQSFFAGRTATGAKRRGVIAFTMPVGVPPGTHVDSVAVVLFMSKSQPGSHGVALHRALADWGEGTSDASLQEGSGAPSTTGDATWVHRFFNTQTWSSVGGDFAATASASVAVDQVGTYTWSSPALLADVQQWVNVPASNFGWVVVGDETALSSAKRFDTKENPDPTVRPRLLLVFRTPTDVGDGAVALRLHPGSPNPFRSQTTITYDLPNAAHVVLRLLDVRGRCLRTFAAPSTPGPHAIALDGNDGQGRALPAGKYLLVLDSDGTRRVQSLVLSR